MIVKRKQSNLQLLQASLAVRNRLHRVTVISDEVGNEVNVDEHKYQSLHVVGQNVDVTPNQIKPAQQHRG